MIECKCGKRFYCATGAYTRCRTCRQNDYNKDHGIMEQYEVESKINGLRNWKINFGDHTVALGRRDRTPDRWVWSLWGGADGWELIDSGALTFEGLKINAHQVARVIMLLTVDYADAPERPEPVAPEPTETTF